MLWSTESHTIQEPKNEHQNEREDGRIADIVGPIHNHHGCNTRRQYQQQLRCWGERKRKKDHSHVLHLRAPSHRIRNR